MWKYFCILWGIAFLFTACTFEINIEKMEIKQELCQDLIEKFAETDENYTPVDYGCGGYVTDEESGECLDTCILQRDCDPEHYCDYTTSICELKTVGKCDGDDQCRSGLCLCEMCMSIM